MYVSITRFILLKCNFFCFNGIDILNNFHNFQHPKLVEGAPLAAVALGVDPMEVGGVVPLILGVAVLLVGMVAVVEEVAMLEGDCILDLHESLHLSRVSYRQHCINISMRK